jgi:hypothetical protein
MPLSAITQSKWVAAVIAAPLLVVGFYLCFVWFAAYVYGNVWDKHLLQNGVSILIGCFFAFAWLGFLLSPRSRFVYWSTLTITVIVGAVQIWDQVVGNILTLRVQPLDIAFTIIALCLILFRASGKKPVLASP